MAARQHSNPRQRLEQRGLTGHAEITLSLDKDRQRKGVPEEKKYAKGKRTKALRSRVTSIKQLKTPSKSNLSLNSQSLSLEQNSKIQIIMTSRTINQEPSIVHQHHRKPWKEITGFVECARIKRVSYNSLASATKTIHSITLSIEIKKEPAFGNTIQYFLLHQTLSRYFSSLPYLESIDKKFEIDSIVFT